MKLEAFGSDIREIIEDEDLDPVDKENFEKMAELTGLMLATIVNMVSREMGEEEFLAEQPEMDSIDPWPGTSDDIGKELIDDIK